MMFIEHHRTYSTDSQYTIFQIYFYLIIYHHGISCVIHVTFQYMSCKKTAWKTASPEPIPCVAPGLRLSAERISQASFAFSEVARNSMETTHFFVDFHMISMWFPCDFPFGKLHLSWWHTGSSTPALAWENKENNQPTKQPSGFRWGKYGIGWCGKYDKYVNIL